MFLTNRVVLGGENRSIKGSLSSHVIPISQTVLQLVSRKLSSGSRPTFAWAGRTIGELDCGNLSVLIACETSHSINLSVDRLVDDSVVNLTVHFSISITSDSS